MKNIERPEIITALATKASLTASQDCFATSKCFNCPLVRPCWDFCNQPRRFESWLKEEYVPPKHVIEWTPEELDSLVNIPNIYGLMRRDNKGKLWIRRVFGEECEYAGDFPSMLNGDKINIDNELKRFKMERKKTSK